MYFADKLSKIIYPFEYASKTCVLYEYSYITRLGK